MNHSLYGNIKIFSCNANPPLAKAIAKELGINLGQSEANRFSDGEINLKIDETIRERDVYVIQPTSYPVNDNLMELLIMIDAMRRASAGRINAVIPYFGYARQDRKARARDPISAKLVANLLTVAGADRIITMDLHCAQIQGFFDIPVDNLYGMPLLGDYYRKKFPNHDDVTVVSPDLGSVARARTFAEKLEVPLAIVDKRRRKANEAEIMNIVGDVEGKKIILVDDMIDTAGTITNAANTLKAQGATHVYACCTHPVLTGKALENIEKSAIEELVVLDTIFLPDEKKLDKMKVLSVAPIIADAINRVHEGISVSKLFDI